MATPASGVDTWLTLNGVPLSFKLGDENLAANAGEKSFNALRITSHAPDGIEIRFDGELLETEVYGRWTWSPRGFAGLYRLEVRVPGRQSYHALVRVLPSLLSFERYKKMLSDISQIAADLAIHIQGPASEKAVSRTRRRPHSALREYELVRRLMFDMAAVMAAIGRSPHKALRERSEMRLAHEVRVFSSSCSPILGSALRLPAAISETIAIKELPAQWWVQENILTYDVYENRLLKHFLWRQMLIRIDSIQERATREIKRRRVDLDIIRRNGWEDTETDVIQKLESVVEECRREAHACMAWGSEPFLRNVGTLGLASRPTQVLQKHPHYGRFYQLYLHFQRSLTLNLDTESYLATLAVRKMSELYETWAIFQMTYLIIHLLLKSGYKLTSSNGWFGIREDWFHLEVDRDADIKLSKEGVQVRIRYEPLYSPLNKVVTGMVVDGSYQLTPDMTVEVWQDDLVTEVIVFDAKYKTEPVAGEQKYLEKDLETMDHYARRICWKSGKPNARPRRVVTSAYILYPGDVLEHDPERPEVGALPLTPLSQQPKDLVAVTKSVLKYSQLL